MSVAVISDMSDRRHYPRFHLTTPARGALRVFPDVLVHEDGHGEWVGISRQPATPGETFVLDVVQFDGIERETRRRIPVCVIESRPVLVDGEMCHRIRFHNAALPTIQFEQQVRRG